MANPTLAEWNNLIAKIRERHYASGAYNTLGTGNDFDAGAFGFRHFYPNDFDAAARPMQDMQSFRLIQQLQYYVQSLFVGGNEQYVLVLPFHLGQMPVMRVGMTLQLNPCKMMEEYAPDPDDSAEWWANNPVNFKFQSWETSVDGEGNPLTWDFVPAYYVYTSLHEARIDAGLSDYSAKPEIPPTDQWGLYPMPLQFAFRRITPRKVVAVTGTGVAQPMTNDTEGNLCAIGHRAYEVISAPWPIGGAPPDSSPYLYTGRVIEKTAGGWIQMNGQLPDVLDTENDRPNYATMNFLQGGDYLAFREYFDELNALINIVQKFAGYFAFGASTATFDWGQRQKTGGSSTVDPDDEVWATVKASSEAGYAAATAVASINDNVEKWARGARSDSTRLPDNPDVFTANAFSRTLSVVHQTLPNPLETIKQIDIFWTPIRIQDGWPIRRAAAITGRDAANLAVGAIKEFNAHGDGYIQDVWNFIERFITADENVTLHTALIGSLTTPDHDGAPPDLSPDYPTTDRYAGYESYLFAIEVTPTFTVF